VYDAQHETVNKEAQRRKKKFGPGNIGSRDPTDSREGKCSQLLSDHCIWVYGKGNILMLIFHYVHNMIISSNDKKCRQAFLNHLRKKWKITEMGKLARFVGIMCSETEHSCRGKSWAIAAPGYIYRAVKHFRMQDAPPIKSGFIVGLDEHDEYVENPKRTNQYRSLIRTLNYECTVCRFDVAHAISVLSRHLNRPTDRLAAQRSI